MSEPVVALVGATGYTGRLIAEQARKAGIDLRLLGRDRDQLARLTSDYGWPARSINLDNETQFRQSLEGVDLVINSAGPFSATALPVAHACLDIGAHYIDVTGEIATFERLHALNRRALDQDIMIMPGAGFAVVASDCLAAHVVSDFPNATTLRIGISRSDLFSRGSARTLLDLYDGSVLIRENTRLQKIPIAALQHHFDFGRGDQPALAVSWPDVFTAYHTTKIPAIECYFETGPLENASAVYGRYAAWMLDLPLAKQLMNWPMAFLPDGPSERSRAESSRVIVAEVSNARGQCRHSRLVTPEAYTFTALSVVEITRRILNGQCLPGYQTPAAVYGPDLATSIRHVVREDLD